jgi:hypothetical protein
LLQTPLSLNAANPVPHQSGAGGVRPFTRSRQHYLLAAQARNASFLGLPGEILSLLWLCFCRARQVDIFLGRVI